MICAALSYFHTLTTRLGSGWNRFWFTAADPYPLCVLRIATGVIALYWLASFSPDLSWLFGTDPLLPSDLMQVLEGPRVSFSVLDYLYTDSEVWAFHIFGLIVVGLFTLGVFTRLTAILSLVVVLSYIQRATVLTGEMEPVLAMLMFYLCLGPAGAALSIDNIWRSRRGDCRPTEPSVSANIALKLLQIHITVIYAMMALSKFAGPNQTWWIGDTVWLLAARPESRIIDVTRLLENHIYVVNAWSHAILLFETAFVLLSWNRLARPLLLAVSVPMWISLALISGLSTFCLTMLVANLAFVSAAAYRGNQCKSAVTPPQTSPSA